MTVTRLLGLGVKQRTTLILLFSFALGAGLVGCRGEKGTSEADSSPVLPTLVRTITIPEGESTEERVFPVIAKEGQTAKLSFRVPGQLREFDPILGKRVAKDEVVARLDPRDYQLAVKRLEESINEANAALSAMKTGAREEDVASLESQVAAAETAAINAKAQLNRMEDLRKSGTASQVQYDLAKTTSDGATAQYESLKKQLEKAKKGAREEEIQAMEARIAGLHVDLNLAENKLKDTELKAPFEGVISQKFFENFETVAPGIAVLELVDADGLEATLNVSEEIVLRKGDIRKIECQFTSIPDAVFPAEVKEVGETIRQGHLSYPLTVRISRGSTESGRRILPGISGTATLTLSSGKETILLPTAALIPSEDPSVATDGKPESAVWKVTEEGTLTKLPVRVKTFAPEGAYIEDGLHGGETIVGAGARFLSEGEKVRTE